MADLNRGKFVHQHIGFNKVAVTEKNIAAFTKAAKTLNKAIQACKADDNNVFAYLDASDRIHLLSGEDGIENTILAEQDLDCSGGDW